MTVIEGGELREVKGSGRERVSYQGGSSIERRLRCLWNERYDMAPTLGHQFPGKPNLLCTSYEFVGIGPVNVDGGNMLPDAEYELCDIYAEYTTDMIADGLMRESFDSSGRVVNKVGGVTFQTTNAPNPNPVSVVLTVIEHNIEKVVSLSGFNLLLPSLLGGCNKVNNAAFKGYPVGTCKFTGFSTRDRFSISAGEIIKSYRLIYRFAWCELPWNQDWDASIAAWNWLASPTYGSYNFGSLGVGL